MGRIAMQVRIPVPVILAPILILGISADATNADHLARPNIVMIMADDLGYECVGAYGGTSYKTPTLDRLAAEGIRFNHCYSQPLCTPSRVKLMTGVYNKRNYEVFGRLPRDVTTSSQVLRQAGYKTCIAGKWQLGREMHLPNHFGFDEYCLWQLTRRPERYPNPGLEINGQVVDFNHGEYGPDVVSDFICDFIKRQKDKPFLVYYPMILTHCPFDPTPDSADWNPASKGSPTYKGKAKYFGDMVNYMDKIIGKIEQQLNESGVRDNTLILFTGDNGTDSPVISMMGDRQVVGGKGRMDDTGTRVPLIANWPGKIKPGQVCDDLIDFSDFFPTLCEAAGTSPTVELKINGRSFLPQLLGQLGNPRQWIYVWYAHKGGFKGREWVRNQRYKLYASGKFFDLESDPLEKRPIERSVVMANQSSASAFRKFSKVLEEFENIRPSHVAEVGERAKARKKNKKRATNKTTK